MTDPAAGAPPTIALAECLAPPLEQEYGTRVAAVERAPSRYATSFAIENLVVYLDDGRVVGLVFKDLSPDGLLDGARRSRPPGVFDPLREPEVYRSLLPDAGNGTPRLVASRVDPSEGCYWLFLEKVDGAELYQVGNLEVWQSAARWLRCFHDRMSPAAAPASLLRYGARWYRRWMQRAVEFAPAASRPAVERLASIHDAVVAGLCRLPQTILHGDFYASNVLAGLGGDGLRICPVDWERAAVGPGLFDLASLVTGWDDRGAAAIACSYAGAEELDTEALALCRLQTCIQWLGWSPDWEPPAEHRRDWLGEATRLAGNLGLL